MTLGILRALAEGRTDQEAAARVHVSTRTVQRVIDNFKQASGARTRFAAGAAACRLGLLDEDVTGVCQAASTAVTTRLSR